MGPPAGWAQEAGMGDWQSGPWGNTQWAVLGPGVRKPQWPEPCHRHIHTHTHMHTRTVSLTYTPCLSHIHTRTMSHTHTHTQLPHPVSRVACPSLERAGWHHQGTSRPPAKPMGQRVKSSPPATQPTAPSWTLGHEGPHVHAPTGNRLGGDLRGALPASMAT